MKVHHLNCGTLCPMGGRLLFGAGPRYMPCHCLLVETGSGLVLVDTGLGLDDVRLGGSRLGRAFKFTTRPQLDPLECAVNQVRSLGYHPDDVRHIVLTHLDLDHAGGVPDFPNARVHVYGPEHRTAFGPIQSRYVKDQFSQVSDWAIYDDLGEPWHGFEAVRQLDGLPPEILMIPLVGHTAGSSGIAVQTTDGWLLHCGDAYFHRGCIHPHMVSVPRMLKKVTALDDYDDQARRENQNRLRALAEEEGHHIKLFCSHDPVEFEGFTA